MEMTSIIADQPTTGLPPATAQAVAEIESRASALTAIAAFITANPDLPGRPTLGFERVLVSLSTEPDPTEAVSAWMLRAIDAGATVELYSHDTFAGVHLHFGNFFIDAYARVELLSNRVEVTRSEWRLGIEIPAHARRESAGGV